MRLHTLAGDVIDLRFLWPPGTMHLGRQAARRYAERAEHVVAMRRDPAKAGGWETLVSSRASPDGMVRLDTYSVVPGLTQEELAIPEAELFLRDKVEPMVNVEAQLEWTDKPSVIITNVECPPLRANAVRQRFESYILSALSNHDKAP